VPVRDALDLLLKQASAVRSLQTWRTREKVKTTGAAVFFCLNLGTDPPDCPRVAPHATLECWIDSSLTPPPAASAAVGGVSAPAAPPPTTERLALILQACQQQYEALAGKSSQTARSLLRVRGKGDPTTEDIKKTCLALRKAAKEDRLLLHYNGHGVPLPTASGELWAFNAGYTQYLPISVSELLGWTGAPTLVVLDCSNAGTLLPSFQAYVQQQYLQALQTQAQQQLQQEQQQQQQQAAASYMGSHLSHQQGAAAAGTVGGGSAPVPAAPASPSAPAGPARPADVLVLAACSPGQQLPTLAALPADLFTCCLTTPVRIALRHHIQQARTTGAPSLCVLPPIFWDLVDAVPGAAADRKTPLGELHRVLTTVTDTIAWTVLPRPLFHRLFRQDLLCATLFRHFLLADRIMRCYGCVPVSLPALPATHDHPLWAAWDAAVDHLLAQLPAILGFSEADIQQMAKLGLKPDLTRGPAATGPAAAGASAEAPGNATGGAARPGEAAQAAADAASAAPFDPNAAAAVAAAAATAGLSGLSQQPGQPRKQAAPSSMRTPKAAGAGAGDNQVSLIAALDVGCDPFPYTHYRPKHFFAQLGVTPSGAPSLIERGDRIGTEPSSTQPPQQAQSQLPGSILIPSTALPNGSPLSPSSAASVESPSSVGNATIVHRPSPPLHTGSYIPTTNGPLASVSSHGSGGTTGRPVAFQPQPPQTGAGAGTPTHQQPQTAPVHAADRSLVALHRPLNPSMFFGTGVPYPPDPLKLPLPTAAYATSSQRVRMLRKRLAAILKSTSAGPSTDPLLAARGASAYIPTPFFEEQLESFGVWLRSASYLPVRKRGHAADTMLLEFIHGASGWAGMAGSGLDGAAAAEVQRQLGAEITELLSLAALGVGGSGGGRSGTAGPLTFQQQQQLSQLQAHFGSSGMGGGSRAQGGAAAGKGSTAAGVSGSAASSATAGGLSTPYRAALEDATAGLRQNAGLLRQHNSSQTVFLPGRQGGAPTQSLLDTATAVLSALASSATQLNGPAVGPQSNLHASPIPAEQLFASTLFALTGTNGSQTGDLSALLGLNSAITPVLRIRAPDQLPVLLQALLSQSQRQMALELLARFLDLGFEATNLALIVGVQPYALRLLGYSGSAELGNLLVFIWAKFLAVDREHCQKLLLADKAHTYFISYLVRISQEREEEDRKRTTGAAKLAVGGETTGDLIGSDYGYGAGWSAVNGVPLPGDAPGSPVDRPRSPDGKRVGEPEQQSVDRFMAKSASNPVSPSEGKDSQEEAAEPGSGAAADANATSSSLPLLHPDQTPLALYTLCRFIEDFPDGHAACAADTRLLPLLRGLLRDPRPVIRQWASITIAMLVKGAITSSATTKGADPTNVKDVLLSQATDLTDLGLFITSDTGSNGRRAHSHQSHDRSRDKDRDGSQHPAQHQHDRETLRDFASISSGPPLDTPLASDPPLSLDVLVRTLWDNDAPVRAAAATMIASVVSDDGGVNSPFTLAPLGATYNASISPATAAAVAATGAAAAEMAASNSQYRQHLQCQYEDGPHDGATAPVAGAAVPSEQQRLADAIRTYVANPAAPASSMSASSYRLAVTAAAAVVAENIVGTNDCEPCETAIAVQSIEYYRSRLYLSASNKPAGGKGALSGAGSAVGTGAAPGGSTATAAALGSAAVPLPALLVPAPLPPVPSSSPGFALNSGGLLATPVLSSLNASGYGHGRHYGGASGGLSSPLSSRVQHPSVTQPQQSSGGGGSGSPGSIRAQAPGTPRSMSAGVASGTSAGIQAPASSFAYCCPQLANSAGPQASTAAMQDLAALAAADVATAAAGGPGESVHTFLRASWALAHTIYISGGYCPVSIPSAHNMKNTQALEAAKRRRRHLVLRLVASRINRTLVPGAILAEHERQQKRYTDALSFAMSQWNDGMLLYSMQQEYMPGFPISAGTGAGSIILPNVPAGHASSAVSAAPSSQVSPRLSSAVSPMLSGGLAGPSAGSGQIGLSDSVLNLHALGAATTAYPGALGGTGAVSSSESAMAAQTLPQESVIINDAPPADFLADMLAAAAVAEKGKKTGLSKTNSTATLQSYRAGRTGSQLLDQDGVDSAFGGEAGKRSSGGTLKKSGSSNAVSSNGVTPVVLIASSCVGSSHESAVHGMTAAASSASLTDACNGSSGDQSGAARGSSRSRRLFPRASSAKTIQASGTQSVPSTAESPQPIVLQPPAKSSPVGLSISTPVFSGQSQAPAMNIPTGTIDKVSSGFNLNTYESVPPAGLPVPALGVGSASMKASATGSPRRVGGAAGATAPGTPTGARTTRRAERERIADAELRRAVRQGARARVASVLTSFPATANASSRSLRELAMGVCVATLVHDANSAVRQEALIALSRLVFHRTHEAGFTVIAGIFLMDFMTGGAALMRAMCVGSAGGAGAGAAAGPVDDAKKDANMAAALGIAPSPLAPKSGDRKEKQGSRLRLNLFARLRGTAGLGKQSTPSSASAASGSAAGATATAAVLPPTSLPPPSAGQPLFRDVSSLGLPPDLVPIHALSGSIHYASTVLRTRLARESRGYSAEGQLRRNPGGSGTASGSATAHSSPGLTAAQPLTAGEFVKAAATNLFPADLRGTWLLSDQSGTGTDPVLQSCCRELGPRGILYAGIWTTLLSATTDPIASIATLGRALVRRILLRLLFTSATELAGRLPRRAPVRMRPDPADDGAAAPAPASASSEGAAELRAGSSSTSAAMAAELAQRQYEMACIDSWDSACVAPGTVAPLGDFEEAIVRLPSLFDSGPMFKSTLYEVAAVGFHRPVLRPIATNDTADPLSLVAVQRATRQKLLQAALAEAVALGAAAYDDATVRALIEASATAWGALQTTGSAAKKQGASSAANFIGKQQAGMDGMAGKGSSRALAVRNVFAATNGVSSVSGSANDWSAWAKGSDGRGAAAVSNQMSTQPPQFAIPAQLLRQVSLQSAQRFQQQLLMQQQQQAAQGPVFFPPGGVFPQAAAAAPAVAAGRSAFDPRQLDLYKTRTPLLAGRDGPDVDLLLQLHGDAGAVGGLAAASAGAGQRASAAGGVPLALVRGNVGRLVGPGALSPLLVGSNTTTSVAAAASVLPLSKANMLIPMLPPMAPQNAVNPAGGMIPVMPAMVPFNLPPTAAGAFPGGAAPSSLVAAAGVPILLPIPSAVAANAAMASTSLSAAPLSAIVSSPFLTARPAPLTTDLQADRLDTSALLGHTLNGNSSALLGSSLTGMTRRHSRLPSEYDGGEGKDAQLSAAILRNDGTILSASAGASHVPIEVTSSILSGSIVGDYAVVSHAHSRSHSQSQPHHAHEQDHLPVQTNLQIVPSMATTSGGRPLSVAHIAPVLAPIPEKGAMEDASVPKALAVTVDTSAPAVNEPVVSPAPLSLPPALASHPDGAFPGQSGISFAGAAFAPQVSFPMAAGPVSYPPTVVMPVPLPMPGAPFLRLPDGVLPLAEEELDAHLRSVASVTPRLPASLLARTKASTVRLARSAARKLTQRCFFDTGSLATTGLLFHPWADYMVTVDPGDLLSTWSLDDGAMLSRFRNTTGGSQHAPAVTLWQPSWSNILRGRILNPARSALTMGSGTGSLGMYSAAAALAEYEQANLGSTGTAGSLSARIVGAQPFGGSSSSRAPLPQSFLRGSAWHGGASGSIGEGANSSSFIPPQIAVSSTGIGSGPPSTSSPALGSRGAAFGAADDVFDPNTSFNSPRSRSTAAPSFSFASTVSAPASLSAQTALSLMSRQRVTGMTWINEHDACHLLTASEDGTIRVWDGSTLTANLSRRKQITKDARDMAEAQKGGAAYKARADSRAAAAGGAMHDSYGLMPPLVASFQALPEMRSAIRGAASAMPSSTSSLSSTIGTAPSAGAAAAAVDDAAAAGCLVHWMPSTCRLAVGGGRSPYVRIWDLQAEKCVAVAPTFAGAGMAGLAGASASAGMNVTSMTSAWPGTDILTAGTSSGAIQVLDLRLAGSSITPSVAAGAAPGSVSGPVVMSLREHKKWVVSVAQAKSGSGYAMVSGSVLSDVRFWDLRRPQSVRSITAHSGPMTSLTVHDFAPVIATGTRKQEVRIFTNTGEPITEIRYHDGFVGQRIGPVAALAFHPHRLYLGVGTIDSIVSVHAGSPDRYEQF
jgi:hypothetical protein